LQPDHRVEGEKQTRRSRREIDCGQAEGQLVGPVPQFPRAIEDGIDQYLERQAALTAERDTPPLQRLGASFIVFTPMEPGPISIRATMAGPSPARSTAAR